MENKYGSVLSEALEIINGERAHWYGDPRDNFQRIADYWNIYLSHRSSDSTNRLLKTDVAMMMLLLKVARLSGTSYSEDSCVDIAGYIALYSDIIKSELDNVS